MTQGDIDTKEQIRRIQSSDATETFDRVTDSLQAISSVIRNAVFGLSALKVLIDAIKAKTDLLTAGISLAPAVKAATINLAQAAGTYDLMTGATEDVIIDRFLLRLPNVNVSDDATITYISIQINDSTPTVLISSELGTRANLTAERQITVDGPWLVKVGKKVQLTIGGGAADAATVCDVVAEYRPVVAGGVLG